MKKITLTICCLFIAVIGFSQNFPGTGAPVDTQNGSGGTGSTCGTNFALDLTVDVSGIGVLGTTNILDQVDIDITHTWNSDIDIFLTAPDGTQVELTTDNGGSGDDYTGTQFRDDAASSIIGSTAPHTGAFQPEAPLATFNGVDADGTWTLNFCDDTGGDTGTFNSWSITFAPAPSCLAPTNLGATVLTATTANLSWDLGGSETTWDVELLDITAGDTATGTPTATGVSNPYMASGLTEGNDYEFYVRADCLTDGASTWAGPFAWSQNVPPANDECADAIALTVNSDLSCGSVTSGTTVFATASSQDDDVTGNPNNDVWFSFVATAPLHTVALSNVTAVTGFSTDMGMGVYDATGGCGALVFVDDSDPNSLDLSGLTVGTTYLVRVYGWGTTSTAQTTFDICVGTPPCVAVAGTLTADAASYVLSGGTATISATPNGDIFVPTDYDVTYVLTSGSNLIIEDVNTTPSFSVTETGDYTIHTLVAETSDNTDPNFLDLSVVTFGTTEAQDVIDIVVAGDLCASLDVTGALISVSSGAVLDFYNVQYVQEAGSSPENGSSESLTLGVGTSVNIYAQAYELGLTDSAGQGAGVECWIAINDEDTDPATWDASVWQVATYLGDVGNNDEYRLVTSDAPVGTNYVAARWRLDNSDFTYGGFNGAWDGTTNVNIELIIEPVPNNDCTGAQVVSQEIGIADAASATATPGTIENATASGLAAEACNGFTGTANDDVWFSFVALTSDVNITYEIAWDGVAQLYSGTCGALSVVDCADSTFGSGPQEEIQATGLTIGETYYTRIYQYSGTASTAGKSFDLKIWSPSVPCTADAGTLTADATPVSLSGGTATISATPNGDSVVPTDFDVTYVLTQTVGADIIIQDANVTPTFVVTTVGNYTIHTLVAETTDTGSSNYLDLSVINFGTTTVADVLALIGTSTITCIDLDLPGAPIVVDDNLSIGDQDNESAFTYFPNPVENTLKLKAQNTISQIAMYNMLGQEVLRTAPNTLESDINMSQLQTGTYFVKVTIGSVTETVRVVKQ